MKKIVDHKPSKKVGRSIHEILPSNITSRKSYQLTHQVQQVTEFNNPYTPFPTFAEWNENEAANFDFSSKESNPNSCSPFIDKDHDKISLPPSFKEEKIVKWLRPEEYVRESLLEKEISYRLPNKKSTKFRRQLKEMYLNDIPFLENNTNSNVINLQTINQEDGELIAKNNSKIYKEFYNIFERDLNLKIVNCTEREEKEEEFLTRVKNELALKGEDLSKNKKVTKSKTVSLAERNKQLSRSSSGKVLDSLSKKKIKTVTPGSITMKDKYNNFSMWLASIFQSIKDLNITDAYTGETLWQKIYPQENKIPVYNRNGRYWVKLHFMGKMRKVEIDDTMPCAKNDKFLLPKCETLEELWPALLTKALIKLYSHKFVCDEYSEVGETCFLYSLTGYIAEKVSLDKLNKNGDLSINLLKKCLTDENYSNKKKFVLCFNNNTPPSEEVKLNEENPPTNVIRKNRREMSVKFKTLKVSRSEHRMKTHLIANSEMMKIFKEKRSSIEKNRTPDVLPNINKQVELKNDLQFDNKFVKFKDDKLISHYRKLTDLPLEIPHKKPNSDKELKENKKINQIFDNSVYSVIELFTNEEFNMNRLKILDFSDLKNKMKEFKLNYKILGKEEKKAYIHHMIELKNQLKSTKLKRIEDLQQSGGRFNFLKVKNKAFGAEMEFKETFTDEQFEMAKKCLLNEWKFPPTSFFERNFISRGRSNDSLADNFSCNSPSPKKTGRKPSEDFAEIKTDNNRDRYKDIYTQLSGDSSKYNISKEPVEREEGQWVELTEFISNFNHFLILHNPKFYSSSLTSDNNWYYYKKDLFELNRDNTIFKLSPNSNFSSKNNKLFNDNSSLLINFTANNELNKLFATTNFYLILELIQLKKETSNICSNSYVTLENIKLDFNHNSFQLDSLKYDQEYFLVIKGGLLPKGFYLEMFSDHLIENIKESSFYKIFLNYTDNIFHVDGVNLEKNKMYIMSKLIVNVKNCITKFKFCIKSNKHVDNDNYLKCFFNLFLVSHSGEKRKLHFSEFCELQPKQEDYYLVLTFTPPYDLKEISYNLEVLTNSNEKNMKISALEMIDPIEVFDFYKYNRHGLVFKEMIYVPEKVFCSLIIDLKHLRKKQKENEVLSKKVSDKEKEIKQSISDFYEEEKLPFNLRMNLEITNYEQETIYKEDFINSTGIINLSLEGNITKIFDSKHKLKTCGKKEESGNIKDVLNNPYYIRCYIDSSQEFVKEEFAWTIRVFSTDTVVLVKDSIKEDLEMEVKNSWERNQPGRASKAKQARLAFLSQQEKVDSTTEEELTKFHTHNILPIIQKETNITDKNDQPYKPTNPCIKSFVDYFENERIITNDTNLSVENKLIRSEEDIKKRKAFINSKLDSFNKTKITEDGIQKQNNQILRDSLKTSYSSTSRNRLEEQEEMRSLLKSRNKLKIQLQETKK